MYDITKSVPELLSHDEYRQLYGPGKMAIETLSNFRLGNDSGTNYAVAFRFQSPRNQALTKIRVYLPGGSGYSGGTGGTIRAEIFASEDYKTVPSSGERYGVATLQLNSTIVARDTAQDLVFENTKPLEEHRHYVIRFTNSASLGNFTSLNTAAVSIRRGLPMRWADRGTWSLLWSRDGGRTWSNVTVDGSGGNSETTRYVVPIMQLWFDKGYTCGYTANESGQTVARCFTASSATPIRETFDAVDLDRRIDGVSILASADQNGAEMDIVLIKNFSTVLATARIRQNTANSEVGNMGSSQIQRQFWYDIPLPQPVFVQKGERLDLEMYPQGSSTWKVSSQVNGSNQGFSAPNFIGSTAQFLRNGAWANYTHRSHGTVYGTANQFNWRVVLHTAPTDKRNTTVPEVRTSQTPSQPSQPSQPTQGTNRLILTQNQVFDAAINGMVGGNDIDYLGWSSPLANMQPSRGAQVRGSAIVMGGTFSTRDVKGGAMKNSGFDGGFNQSEMNVANSRPADMLQFWWCLVPAANGENCIVEIRNPRVWAKPIDQNVWIPIFNNTGTDGAVRISNATWNQQQGPSMNPWNAAERAAYGSQFFAEQFGHREPASVRGPTNNRFNCHGGHGDVSIAGHSIDRMNVHGIMGTYEMRVVSGNASQLSVQLGFDPKWSGINPTARGGWWPGLMLSKLQRLSSEWRTYGIVNINTAGDANRGGVVLTESQIRGATIRGL